MNDNELLDLDLFADHLRKLGKKPATIDSYRRDAKHFVNFCKREKVLKIEPELAKYFQDYLIGNNEKPNSVRRSLIGVRQYLRFCSAQSNATPAFDGVALPNRQVILPKYLSQESINRIFASCAKSQSHLKQLRDSAIIALLAFEGIKASELIEINWSDLFFSNKSGEVTLHILSSRKRHIIINNLTAEHIFRYRDFCHKENEYSKKMFVAFKGRQTQTTLSHMTRHGLKFMLSEVGHESGITNLSSEKLRHFAISFQISNGKSPEEVAAHLGLKRLGNIAKYCSLQQTNQT